MPTQSMAAPVRHGKAGLFLRIWRGTDYDLYRIKRHRRDMWAVTHTGDGGRSYLAGRTRGENGERGRYCCTCPDRLYRGAWCKHLAALVTLGLVSRPRKGVVS